MKQSTRLSDKRQKQKGGHFGYSSYFCQVFLHKLNIRQGSFPIAIQSFVHQENTVNSAVFQKANPTKLIPSEVTTIM